MTTRAWGLRPRWRTCFDGHASISVTAVPKAEAVSCLSELLHRMKEPTVALRGSSLGDAFGICWFLRDVDGVRTVGHGGSANGQFAELLAGAGTEFCGRLAVQRRTGRYPLQPGRRSLGASDLSGGDRARPEPLAYDEARAREVVGSYENEYMTLTIGTDGAVLRLDVRIKPEIRAAAKTEPPPDLAPADIGLLPGDTDGYMVTGRQFEGAARLFHS